MIKTNAFSRVIKSSLYFVSLAGVVLLQGCMHDDDDTVVLGPAIETPDGYFTGTATVKADDNVTDLIISDLKAMVNGNRFMVMSANSRLLYDGTFTDISESDFTASVNIYYYGALVSTSTTVSGLIVSESSIKGTLAGDGFGNGTFDLTYSLVNQPSALTEVAKDWEGTLAFGGFVDKERLTSDVWQVSVGGELSLLSSPFSSEGVQLCQVDSAASSLLPVAGINVYAVKLFLTDCSNPDANGSYTGLASSTIDSSTDDQLAVAFSNSSFSGSGLWGQPSIISIGLP